jgi:hypothetical protein
VIRAVSSDMFSTFYAYLLDEYRPVQYLVDHEQILVHGQGSTAGAALSLDAGGLVPHFWCIATADRYAFKTAARQLANAQQQLAAQYRILTG